MQASIHGALTPVRRRQQALFVLRASAWGLLVGGLAAAVVGAGRLWLGWLVSPWLGVAVLAGGPALGALAGLCCRRSWHAAALAVDQHYHLKDRSATALEFLAKTQTTPLHELQVADAMSHLGNVEPQRVVPLSWPRSLLCGAGAMVVALALLLYPIKGIESEAGAAEPMAHIVAEAERIQEALQELEEIAQKEDDKGLQELVNEMRQKAEEMKQADVDEREALAKLSEMEAAVQAMQAQFNMAVVDGQLQSLGTAMRSANATEGAGKALEQGKYEKGAEELEKLEEVQFDRKEAKALEEKLKQVAKESNNVGLGQLSAAVSDLADAVKGGKGNVKKATKTLAKEVSKQAKRRKINDLLNAQLEDLKESKCNCQCNSLAKGKKPEKSTSPSSTFGMTTSGNVFGDKTSLLGQRKEESLTGTPGEGPSDVETTSSPEARQQARRSYRESYQNYRKESEAVLDSEAIPLGHRQTIRRYFELIRPQNNDMPEKNDAGDMKKP